MKVAWYGWLPVILCIEVASVNGAYRHSLWTCSAAFPPRIWYGRLQESRDGGLVKRFSKNGETARATTNQLNILIGRDYRRFCNNKSDKTIGRQAFRFVLARGEVVSLRARTSSTRAGEGTRKRQRHGDGIGDSWSECGNKTMKIPDVTPTPHGRVNLHGSIPERRNEEGEIRRETERIIEWEKNKDKEGDHRRLRENAREREKRVKYLTDAATKPPGTNNKQANKNWHPPSLRRLSARSALGVTIFEFSDLSDIADMLNVAKSKKKGCQLHVTFLNPITADRLCVQRTKIFMYRLYYNSRCKIGTLFNLFE